MKILKSSIALLLLTTCTWGQGHDEELVHEESDEFSRNGATSGMPAFHNRFTTRRPGMAIPPPSSNVKPPATKTCKTKTELQRQKQMQQRQLQQALQQIQQLHQQMQRPLQALRQLQQQLQQQAPECIVSSSYQNQGSSGGGGGGVSVNLNLGISKAGQATRSNLAEGDSDENSRGNMETNVDKSGNEEHSVYDDQYANHYEHNEVPTEENRELSGNGDNNLVPENSYEQQYGRNGDTDSKYGNSNYDDYEQSQGVNGVPHWNSYN